mmetsp:Transcript_19046/g.26389  ORF Transcript_19046/g.26389 Transcript_19046/m.26389 type:complete len:81 (-) Transcript_19046:170-412(-)
MDSATLLSRKENDLFQGTSKLHQSEMHAFFFDYRISLHIIVDLIKNASHAKRLLFSVFGEMRVGRFEGNLCKPHNRRKCS